jgi:hypothetical protein
MQQYWGPFYMALAAEDTRYDAKVSSIGRLFQMLTNIFGQEKDMRALAKIEGAEVLGHFPKLGNRYFTLKVANCHVLPFRGKSEHAMATISFNVPYERIAPLIIDVVRTKANLWGLIKLAFKYLLPGKVKLRGSLGVAIKLIKIIMVGQHPMYK